MDFSWPGGGCNGCYTLLLVPCVAAAAAIVVVVGFISSFVLAGCIGMNEEHNNNKLAHILHQQGAHTYTCEHKQARAQKEMTQPASQPASQPDRLHKQASGQKFRTHTNDKRARNSAAMAHTQLLVRWWCRRDTAALLRPPEV